MSKQILVNSSPYETRVATLEDGEIKSLHIEREEDRNVVGNIYKGLVKRVLPGMQAAFLELGLERTAFLYVDDIIDEPFGTEFDYGEDEGEGESEFDESELDGDEGEDPLGSDEAQPDVPEGPPSAEAAVVTAAPVDAAAVTTAEAQPQEPVAAVPTKDFHSADEDDNRGNRQPEDRRDLHGPVGDERRDDRDDRDRDGGRNFDRERNRNHSGGGRHRDRTRDSRGDDRNRHAQHRGRDQGGRHHDDRNQDRNQDRNRDPREQSRDHLDHRDPHDFQDRGRPPEEARLEDRNLEPRDQRDYRDFSRNPHGPEASGAPAQEFHEPQELHAEGRESPPGNKAQAERSNEDLDFVRRARLQNRQMQDDDFYPEERHPEEREGHRDPRDQSRDQRDQRRDHNRDRNHDRHAGGGENRSGGGRDRDRGRGDRHGRGGPQRAHRRGGRGGGGRPRRRERRNVEIQDLLKEGQELLVQVAKAPIGTKGARLTTHISLPGRNLVLMPTVKHLGISRRIESERERRRLREIFTKRIRTNGEVGFIIRTVAEGKSYRELKADADYLLHLWDQIQDRTKKKKAPALIHEDLGLALKTMRDDFTDDVDSLVIDNQQDYNSVLDFISQFSPRLKGKVKLFRGPSQLFEHYGIEAEISRALGKKVWLKSGGYLLIDQSEALTAIDVNTGRYVGSKSLEETILKTNLEAVKEISYQLRIRNVGGIIIIDLIDMENAQNRKKVYDALQEALSEDRAKTNILKISELGLVEMTRKRTHEDLVRYLTEQCSYCEGRGYHKSRRTICFEIFREIEKEAIATTHKNIVVFANSEVIGRITKEEKTHWKGLEERLQRQIVVKADPNFHVEQFEVFSKP